MTYKDYITKLKNDSLSKYAALLKAERKLDIDSEDALLNPSNIEKYKKAHKAWQKAHNLFIDALTYIAQNKIKTGSRILRKDKFPFEI